MDGIPVTLIVKAPNQQIEDQTIQCELSWTISKLKGYLAEVYPSKPTTDEQKIIYSGQLLNDSTVLKDVLRQYDSENSNIHTMHLVCLPKRFKQQSPETRRSTKTQETILNDGLRHRNVTGTPNSASSSREQPAASSSQARVSEPSPEGPAAAENANWSNAWNANWMQYMSQNPQAFNYSYAPFTGNTTHHQQNLDPRFAPPPMNLQQHASAGIPLNNQYAWMQYMYMQYMQQYGQMIANGTFPQAQYPYQYAQVQQPVQQNTNEPQAEAGGDVPEPVAPQADEDNVDGVQQAGDFLDRFYIILRWSVLVLIIYFYSSPVRFALVLSLGFIIYIYRLGFFRPIPARIMMPHERVALERARQERAEAQANGQQANAEPHDANPNVERPEQQNPNPEQNMDADREPNGQNANAEHHSEAQQAPAQNQRENEIANNQNTLLNITWTIFTSFFTSLIPDAPNAL